MEMGQHEGKIKHGDGCDGGVHGRRGVESRCCLPEALVARAEALAAQIFRFLKPPHKKAWFSDASFEAVGEVVPGYRVYWKHNLTEGERARTINSWKEGLMNRLSINDLELLGTGMTAFMIV